MADWIGRFDDRDSLILPIEVVFPPLEPVYLDAIIDTGFTGFLALPFSSITILESQITGVRPITLADGSSSLWLKALATITIERESRTGVTILGRDAPEVIIGIDFLRVFGRRLIVSTVDRTVVLTRESEQ